MEKSFESTEFDPRQFCRSMVKLRSVIPEDAFTAGILGAERVGNGVVIGADGLVLTIGYLITEASDVWLTPEHLGREVAGHPLAYDQVTGFGLVMPLENLSLPALEFGRSDDLRTGSKAFVLSSSELAKPQEVHVFARREFAGAWEYLIESALFTMPAHTHWSGAALVDAHGALLGLGSLLVREVIGENETNVNMFVPIDLLKPILDDLRKLGRTTGPSRPWIGVYAVELRGKVYVSGVADGSPAQQADLREGDQITRVGEHEINTLPNFYRQIWALGPASISVPLTLIRGGMHLDVNVRSVDRTELLKQPVGH